MGWLCEKFVTPGKKGPPDQLITLPCGHKPLAETKRRRGRVRKHQELDHAARRRVCGEIVFIPRSKACVDWLIGNLFAHVIKCHVLPPELTSNG